MNCTWVIRPDFRAHRRGTPSELRRMGVAVSVGPRLHCADYNTDGFVARFIYKFCGSGAATFCTLHRTAMTRSTEPHSTPSLALRFS